MIKLRLYEPEDYIKVSRREYDRLTFGTRGDPILISRQLTYGPAFTLVADEGLVACGGVLPVWTGVAEGWGITSDLVCKYPVTFAKTIHHKLTQIINDLKLVRVQTIVDKDFKVSQRWVERMGFRFEGEMEKYIAGRTYLRYAWIRRENV